jgi:hypothetical protein
MPLVRFLGNHSFGPEAIAVMTAVFEDTLRTLGLVDHTGLATEIVAKKIIELARQGECDPVRLRDRAVQSLSL